MKLKILLLAAILVLPETVASAQDAPKAALPPQAAGFRAAAQQGAASQDSVEVRTFQRLRDLQELANKKDDGGHPPGIALGRTKLGPTFVDRQGRTLYTLDVHALFAFTSMPMEYCENAAGCTQHWTALPAPTDAAAVGMWKPADGPQGHQWTYRGLPVFTYADDKAPGSTSGQYYHDMFVAMTFEPPAPTVHAPASIKTAFIDGGYILTDQGGRALFIANTADCGAPCAKPLAAGMASRNVGAWTVSRNGYPLQWDYRGKPVYVSQEDDPTAVPDGATPLRP